MKQIADFDKEIIKRFQKAKVGEEMAALTRVQKGVRQDWKTDWDCNQTSWALG